jgi:hypothetical protein
MVATFGGEPVTLLDLSQNGARIAHRVPLRLGEDRTLVVDVPNKRQHVEMRGRVMWTHIDAGQRLSGVRWIGDRIDLVADLLEYLLQLRQVRYDREAIQRKGTKGTEPQTLTSRTPMEALLEIDETKPVIQAKQYLERNPQIARQWRMIALSAATEDEHRAHSLEVLAVWELLNRSVRVEVVEFVFQLL